MHSVPSQYVPLRLCDPLFSVPEKPTAFVGEMRFYFISADAAQQCRACQILLRFPIHWTAPLSHSHVNSKSERYAAGSSFSHYLKRILSKLPAFRKPFFQTFSSRFPFPNLQKRFPEPIFFLPNPFMQLSGSPLSLRFALSSLLFPFGSSFPLGKTYCRKGFQSQMKERTNPASEKNIQETSSAFLFSVGSCFLFSSLSVILIYRFFSHLSSTFQ